MLDGFPAIHSGLPNVQSLCISSEYLSTLFSTCKKDPFYINRVLSCGDGGEVADDFKFNFRTTYLFKTVNGSEFM